MAFKNIEQATEQQYEGYQFVDFDCTLYSASFMDVCGTTCISSSDDREQIVLYTKDLPKMIKVLQAVYDKYAEDNSGF